MPVQIPAGEIENTASKRMVAFLFALADERKITQDERKRLIGLLERHQDDNDAYQMSRAQARKSIEWLLKRDVRPGIVPDRLAALPKREKRKRPSEPTSIRRSTRNLETDPLPTNGVFRYEDNVYIVVPSRRNPGRYYAKRLIKSPSRLTSAGTTVDFDYVDAPGMIWYLHEEHRIPLADLREMMIERKVCIYPGCYRSLRAARSVERGAGKVHAQRLGLI